MVKHLQKVGNSKGIVIDKPILKLLNIDEDASFELTTKNGGLFLRPINTKEAYSKVSKRHRKSLDKLAN